MRLTMGEAGNAAKIGLRSNPSKFVLDGIMACVDLSEDDLLDPNLAHRDIARSEMEFLGWIVQSFKKRDSWPVGEWISAVMEESLTKATEAFTASVV